MPVGFIQGYIKTDFYQVDPAGERSKMNEDLFCKMVNSGFYHQEYGSEGRYKCNCNILKDKETGRLCFISVKHTVNPRNGRPTDNFNEKTGRFEENKKKCK